MGAMDGRNGIGDDAIRHQEQLHGERRAEVHPCRASLHSGRPSGPADDVHGGHDARQQHIRSPSSVQAAVLRNERRREFKHHGKPVKLVKHTSGPRYYTKFICQLTY
jgi:hypothetical protein